MSRKIRLVAIIFSLFIGSVSYAQLTQPGGGDGSAPSDGGIAGGGAPIGSGVVISVLLASAYTGKKYFLSRKED